MENRRIRELETRRRSEESSKWPWGDTSWPMLLLWLGMLAALVLLALRYRAQAGALSTRLASIVRRN